MYVSFIVYILIFSFARLIFLFILPVEEIRGNLVVFIIKLELGGGVCQYMSVGTFDSACRITKNCLSYYATDRKPLSFSHILITSAMNWNRGILTDVY